MPVQVNVRGAPGLLDRSFGRGGEVNAMYIIDAVAEQPDGKIIFTGRGDAGLSVCRLEIDGSPDFLFGASGGCATLDPNASAVGQALAVHESMIYVAGSDSKGAGIARFTRDGALDTTFGVEGWAAIGFGVYEILIRNEKIILAGDAGGKGVIARLNLDGTSDSSFTMTSFGSNAALHLVQLPDCRLVATTGFDLYAFHADGKPDLTFGNGGAVSPPFGAEGLATSPSGEILTAGGGMSVSRFSGSGVLIANYNSLHNMLAPRNLVLAPDGTMLFGGSIWSGGEGRIAVGRRLPDGSADPGFGVTSANYFGSGVAIDSLVLRDGRILLGGTIGESAGTLIRVWN